MGVRSYIILTRVKPDLGGDNKVFVMLDRLDWIEPRIYGGKLCSALWFSGKTLTVSETPDEVAGLLNRQG